MFRDAESERRKAAEYIGGKRFIPTHQMTPTQLRAARGMQLRRLSGLDGSLDVTVECGAPEPIEEALAKPVRQRKPRATEVRPAPGPSR